MCVFSKVNVLEKLCMSIEIVALDEFLGVPIMSSKENLTFLKIRT